MTPRQLPSGDKGVLDLYLKTVVPLIGRQKYLLCVVEDTCLPLKLELLRLLNCNAADVQAAVQKRASCSWKVMKVGATVVNFVLDLAIDQVF